jgi:hypothetical protein
VKAARTVERSRPAVLTPRAKPLPRKLDCDFSKLKAQSDAFRAFQPGNRVTIPWGRGCGKSWFARRLAYLLVAKWDAILRPQAALPGVRIVFLMPTLEQARKVHTYLLLAELDAGGEWGFLGAKINKSSWTITFPGGSWIQFVTAERAQFIRGIRCDAVFIDEADDIDPEMVDSVVDPWFSEPHSLRQMLIGGTPRRGRGGLLYKAFKEWPELDNTCYFGFHATAFDAPKIVDRAYLLKVQARTPLVIFNREWLCDFDSAEGLIFPMFRGGPGGFHVRPLPPEILSGELEWDQILVAADHGYEDPGVLLLLGVLGRGRDACVWVIAEIYEQHREPDWWLAQVKEILGDYPEALWYADPARPDIISSWKTAGCRIRDVDKGAGSVEAGIGYLQRYLHVRSRKGADGGVEEYARLYVTPDCENTINEFGLYRRKRSRSNSELVLEDIEDANNHAMDALRYAICNFFEGPPRGRNAANTELRS